MLKKTAPPAGIADARKLRVAIVASAYNAEYVDSMLEAALDSLKKGGAKSVDVHRVPGAYEIPVAAAACARSGRYDVVINLGLIIGMEPFTRSISARPFPSG
ncbi:6,7-dimethyl-8-ribityllumazine synthase [Oscillatoria laete-virens NRMC-F 0139]|nr:6,7-dimethyl-8-ribityllumazine synthase [Oscillatoria laete-virens]MDL5054707.1 6,7-dimethyl-8-ribityllumazine synthase [Oscillatoria laete-virens NRMC-F 0139]